MPLNLFRKNKEPKQETLSVPTQEEQPKQETPPAEVAPEEPKPEPTGAEQEPTQQEPIPESAAPAAPMPEQEPEPPVPEETQKAAEPEKPSTEEKPEASAKTYLKAMPLKDLSDVEDIKKEVKNGNIIILRITPLASKSIEDVKTAVNDLFQFAESIGGDIARLGEERVVVCPKTVRIWREKSPAPVSSPRDPLPTTA